MLKFTLVILSHVLSQNITGWGDILVYCYLLIGITTILRSPDCEIYYGNNYGLCGIHEYDIICLCLDFAISAKSLCFFCLNQSVILALRSYIISIKIFWLKYVENQVACLKYRFFRILVYRSGVKKTKTRKER